MKEGFQLGHYFDLKSVWLKFSILLLLLVYILMLFKLTLASFRTEDPLPHLSAIGGEMRAQFRDFTAKVRTGLYIKNFSTFDFLKNRFVLDATVWFHFDANAITLETIENFSFENSKILYKSSPDVTLEGDKIFARYNITLEAKTDARFYRFPLEDHRLSLVMTNDFVSPNEMYFDDKAESLSFDVSKNIFTSDWKVHELRVQSGYGSIQLDRYNKDKKMINPKVVFGIDFQKSGIKKVLIVFVPMFAAAFFSLFIFLMSLANFVGKFQLAMSAVTALLGYRFVIERIGPSVGYSTTTDLLYIFFLVFSFVIFIFQLLLTQQWDASSNPNKENLFRIINNCMFGLAVIVFVILVSYILFM